MDKKPGSFVIKAFVAAIVLGFGSAAHAQKPGKVSILHCGADEGAETMTFKTISVSPTSKGHANHKDGSTDSEGTGVIDPATDEEIVIEYVRTNDDCLLEGVSATMDLQACDVGAGQSEGLDCGMQVAPAIATNPEI